MIARNFIATCVPKYIDVSWRNDTITYSLIRWMLGINYIRSIAMSFFKDAKKGREFFPNKTSDRELPSSVMKVLKNTYLAIFMGLMVMAFSGYLFSDVIRAGSFMLMIGLIVATFVLLFITLFRAERPDGLLWYFAFMAVEGVLVGGVVSLYAESYLGAVFSAAVTTAAMFVGLSAYVIATKKDLNHWGGYLMVSLIALIIGSIIALFIGTSTTMVVLSGISAVIFSMFIMYDTSRIITSTETSYVRGAVGMSLNIINLFLDFLNIFSFFSDD